MAATVMAIAQIVRLITVTVMAAGIMATVIKADVSAAVMVAQAEEHIEIKEIKHGT
jgi:citrate lyase gamma subunit